MNKIFVSVICAAALLPIVANGQVSTVGGTESIGKITDYTPDTALVLDTGSGEPVHYKFAKRVTYVDKEGTTIQAHALTKHQRVKVHNTRQGGDRIINKVTLAEGRPSERAGVPPAQLNHSGASVQAPKPFRLA